MTPPTTLFHYTTGAALTSILEHEEVWATDARYLNDSAEFTFGREELRDTLLKLADEIDERPPGDLNETAYELPEFVRSLVSQDASHDAAPYVACFCAEDDLLSQWRAYGDGAYSIGFDTTQLERIPSPPRGVHLSGNFEPGFPNGTTPELVEVRYGRERIPEMVAEVRAYYSGLSQGPHFSDYYSKRLRALVGLASVKDRAFASELEWRLVIDPHEIDSKFRVDSRSTVVPYVALKFEPSAITSVRVGPDMHPEARGSVDRILKRYEYRDVQVSQSGAPYRR